MKTTTLFQKSISLVLLCSFILSGCALNKQSATQEITDNTENKNVSKSQVTGIPFAFEVKPEDFTLSFQVGEHILPVSGGNKKQTVTDYEEREGRVSWRYKEEQVAVSLTPVDDYLSVEIRSEKEEDHSFTWPNITADTYYIPFGEGKRIPAEDAAWQTYLNKQEVTVLEQLSMPFWIASAGEYSVLFIMENPYRTQMDFTADSGVAFSVTHEYARIDGNKTNRFRVYVTDNNPVSAAKLYRNYVIEKGNFKTLEQKASENTNIRKLYGAPFLYLWGDFIVSANDIDWQAFRQSLDTPVVEYLLSFAESQENGTEFVSVIEEIKRQDYVAEYQKNVICSYLSQLLKLDGFYQSSVFPQSSGKLDELLEDGYEKLGESDKIQVHKYALAQNLPEVFADAGQWMDSSTVGLLKELKESGIQEAWIGLNSWEQAYAKPELVETADELGYLMASYDSYHSIHEPGREQWITAKFSDTSLYEEATVTDKNGEKISGFKDVGRKLNPALSLPAVEERMTDILSNSLPFQSWFIDCDATGEIYDDYTPSHTTTQEEDLAARLERMSYIRDRYNLVIGSEGGNDFAASTIAFAHGIELKSFSWMDEDMKNRKDSEFYIGKYYNPKGGVAEHFAKRIPVKEEYDTVFVNPQYDIPLFKLVYNESVITSYHWDWSTFKIKGATQDRMVREVLYNVPPLYHLDAAEWKKYKADILKHQSVWSDFSKKVITQEMTDFEYLSEDGKVQRTVYGGEISAVANFGDLTYQHNEVEIPGHSVLIQIDGTNMVYTPDVSRENQ